MKNVATARQMEGNIYSAMPLLLPSPPPANDWKNDVDRTTVQ